ncbi:MAG: hypothetical protein K2W92_08720 [Alphaproteobacteria bacterium]|nr:hypothetical protein [Alphaproteobacteria bacterium]
MLFLGALFFCGIISQAMSVPEKVILIRHSEKIPNGNQLDLRGLERAQVLPYYFAHTPLYNTPPITHIFAAGLKSAGASVRPIQTCSPIANFYNLPLNINFKNFETKEIATELLTNPKYDHTSVLICWSHGHIREIVTALGGDDPGKWSTHVFDQVYLLTFTEGEKPKFEKILQKLMFGDRTTFEDNPLPLPQERVINSDKDS